MRPSEYAGHHVVDDTHVTQLFNQGMPLTEALKPEFEQLVYGRAFQSTVNPGLFGYRYSTGPHGLERSVATRIKADLGLDNGLCLDLGHPDAFKNNGKFDVAALNAADFALNKHAFSNAGDTGGLNYNIFCSGNVALADGRWLFIGGHDKTGPGGIAKLSIFDPESQTWADRGLPPVKEDFLDDPEGLTPFHANPLDENNTDPLHPSDMKYQRWYPSGVVLPDGRVLILSGTDVDTSLGRAGFGFNCTLGGRTSAAVCSKVRIATPEVYDPVLDTTIALENARKLFNMYTHAYVVKTGKGENDWKVAVTGEVNADFLDEDGLIPLEVVSGSYDPWTYTGKTYYLDVLAALNDPKRDKPAEKHWKAADTAEIAHDSGAGAQLWELDDKGEAISQMVTLFGGGCGRTRDTGIDCDRATVETIDFQDKKPEWQRQDDLIREATQNNATPLPDGTVLIAGGSRGRGPWFNTFELQLFDPASGTITPLVHSALARHDHSTIALLQDGSVAIMGGNRTDVANDHLTGLDVGVPAAQIYQPAYFFNGPPPVIEAAPDDISYGNSFDIEVSGGSGDIGSVVIIRIGPVSHSLDWGNRYVKLHFEEEDDMLHVTAPAGPALAIPGDYLLFVVSDQGVPGEAKVVHVDGA